MNVTISIPTRGEAPLLDPVVRSYLDNAAQPDLVRIVVCVDDDDPAWQARELNFNPHPSVMVSRAPREDALGDKWNRAIALAPAGVYGAGTDDNSIVTQGWDDRLREGAALFEDGIGVLYFGEAPNAQLPMMQAVTQGWVDGFGGIYPSHFPYWFIDMWLDELAMMTGRMCWVEIGLNSLGGRGKTRGLRDVRFWNQFFDLTRPVRESIADAAIAELYKDARWMAWRLQGKARLGLRMVFEGRSKFIQAEAVEAQATRAEDNPEDARYVRIKAAAESYLSSLYCQTEAQA
jgi:hypothetical protein